MTGQTLLGLEVQLTEFGWSTILMFHSRHELSKIVGSVGRQYDPRFVAIGVQAICARRNASLKGEQIYLTYPV